MQYQPIVVPGGNYYQPGASQPASSPYKFDPNEFSGDINYSAKQAQLGNYYNAPVPTYPITPIGNAPSYTTNTDYAYDAQQAMYGGLNKSDLDMSQASVGTALGMTEGNPIGNPADPTMLGNAQTAWGKMSYGEKGSAMLSAATSLYGAYNARKTGKLAQEQFQFTKDSFNRNFEASAKTTNSALADRQNARNIRNPNAHASVSDYMKKYGV